MKHLSRDEMKKVMGGYFETIGDDEDTYKCCIGSECTHCVHEGGITCSAAATKTKC